ncbi:hypothetical protein [Novosphingobium colocasiae]
MAVSMRKGLVAAVVVLVIAGLAVMAWRAGGEQPVAGIVQPVAVPELPR